MATVLDPAPELRAAGVRGRGDPVEVRLSDLRGRWAVVFFYPRDFTPVCPTELRELTRRVAEFRALDVELLALSVDDVATHRRWIAEALGEVPFPLLSDPGGAIARAWGALLEPQGVATRATFVVDPGGVIQQASFHNLAVGRSISELLRVIEALRTGDRAPADWRPGEPTLGR